MHDTGTWFSDSSPIGKIRISGENASEFVRVMTTVEPWRLEMPGQFAVALVLNAEGDIIDLVMIARTGDQEYILFSSPETTDELVMWLQAHAEIVDGEGGAVFEDLGVEDVSSPIATIALYGPKAQMILDELSGKDVSETLGDKNLALFPIGQLQVMIVRWPFLRAHGWQMPLEAEGEVFEVYLPAQASEDFKQILLGFAEIDPESFEDYKARRRAAHTWFAPAEQAAYIKPESSGLRALLRSSSDYVGAKALERLGLLSH